MLKRLKTVSMMLFLMGTSTGAAFAISVPGVDDVKITQQSETATGTVVDAMGPVIGASVVVKVLPMVQLPTSTVISLFLM